MVVLSIRDVDVFVAWKDVKSKNPTTFQVIQTSRGFRNYLLILKLCGLSLFYYASNRQNIPPIGQVFNKEKDKNSPGLPSSILQPQSNLRHCIIFSSNKH